MKYFNFKRYKFVSLFKNVNFKMYSFLKLYKYLNFKRYNYSRIFKYFDFRRYNLLKILQLIEIKKLKFLPIYVTAFIAFITITYLLVPFFYDYNKLNVKKILCKELHVNCVVQGKIKYHFFPTPRIKLDNILIKDFANNKKTIGEINTIHITLPVLKLLEKKNFEYKKIHLKNGKIYLDFQKINDYKKYITNKFGTKPIYFTNTIINFFDNDKYITSIRDINFKFKPKENSEEIELDGSFLNDKISIKFNNKKEEKVKKILILKMDDSNIFLKANMVGGIKSNDLKGNLSLQKDKNKITSQIIYKKNKLNILKANIRNTFLDGKFSGVIDFLPFFTFDLDFNLNGLNLTKFYSFFNELDAKEIFKVNKKINGQISLSSSKLYSRYNLVNSFESRIKFVNGDVIIDQFLLNMGKLGAADIVGVIENNKKFTSFKFEKNIFIDNLKTFNSKFGIYNKEKKPASLFIEGNFDLINLNLRIREIFSEGKIKENDISYIEREFNEILLENGYVSLFDFSKLKVFVKTISTETN